tara:strand:- start:81 stop:650 length:570 start_codon:yes stop_codon:yes gene_type:complete
MESDFWDEIEPENKSLESSLEGTVASPQGAFDGQIIMLQPPSNASKIIGICCIIFGAFNIISLLSLLFIPQVDPLTNEEISVSTSSFIISILSALISIVTLCVGGYMMVNFQKRGIFIVIGGIFVGFIISTISVMMGDFDGWGESVGMSDNAANGILIGVQALCNVLCGVIVAIPLMIANNGLDNPKVF